MMGESWKRMAEKAIDALATVTTERDAAKAALAQEQGRSQGLREVCEMLRSDLAGVTRERDAVAHTLSVTASALKVAERYEHVPAEAVGALTSADVYMLADGACAPGEVRRAIKRLAEDRDAARVQVAELTRSADEMGAQRTDAWHRLWAAERQVAGLRESVTGLLYLLAKMEGMHGLADGVNSYTRHPYAVRAALSLTPGVKATEAAPKSLCETCAHDRSFDPCKAGLVRRDGRKCCDRYARAEAGEGDDP